MGEETNLQKGEKEEPRLPEEYQAEKQDRTRRIDRETCFGTRGLDQAPEREPEEPDPDGPEPAPLHHLAGNAKRCQAVSAPDQGDAG